MNFLLKYIWFVGITFGALSSWANPLLPQKRIPRNNSLFVDLSTEVLYSQGNFDNKAFYENLENEGYITLFNYKLNVLYAPSSWVHIEPYIQAQTHIVRRINLDYLPFRPTKTGLKGSFFIHTPFVALSPEINFSYPLDRQKTRIVTNDGVIQLTPALFIHLSFLDSFIPFGKIAYQYRQDLSGLLLYQGGFMYQDNIWEIGALLGGFSSVIPDQNPNTRHSVLNRFNAGSLKFYSANPSILGTALWADLKLSNKTQVFIHGGFSFFGFNYAQEFSLNIGFRRGFIKSKSPYPYRRAIHDFEEKKEDMESLFYEGNDSSSPY